MYKLTLIPAIGLNPYMYSGYRVLCGHREGLKSFSGPMHGEIMELCVCGWGRGEINPALYSSPPPFL